MEKILHRIHDGDGTNHDLDLLLSVASNIEGNTICALGEAAAWPVKGFLNKFRDEFEKHVKPHRSFIPLNVVHAKRPTAGTLLETN